MMAIDDGNGLWQRIVDGKKGTDEGKGLWGLYSVGRDRDRTD